MEAERTISSSPTINDRYSEWNGSRRELFQATGRIASRAVVAGTIGTLGTTGWQYKDEALDWVEGRSAREEFDRYIKDQGFDEVDDFRRKELLGETDVSSFSEIESMEYEPQEPDGIKNVEFSLDKPTYVVVTVEGDYDEIGSLPVVSANFGEYEYVVPILQTRYENSQTFALKSVEPGSHTLQFHTTPQSGDIGERGIKVSVRTPVELTRLGQAVLDTFPVLGMQTEFALNDVYNNDAPFFRNGYLYERKSDGKVRAAYFEGRTEEEGGIGEDPVRMNEELNRIFDYDHSVIPTIGVDDALVYALAHQDDRIRAHRIIEEDEFPYGVDPKTIPERFFYRSVPDHGMVKPGLEKDRRGNLVHNKVYSIYPNFYPHRDSEIEEERFRVRKLIAIQECKREHEKKMDELMQELAYPELFTSENFPEEFETQAFLIEEEKQLLSE